MRCVQDRHREVVTGDERAFRLIPSTQMYLRVREHFASVLIEESHGVLGASDACSQIGDGYAHLKLASQFFKVSDESTIDRYRQGLPALQLREGVITDAPHLGEQRNVGLKGLSLRQSATPRVKFSSGLGGPGGA